MFELLLVITIWINLSADFLDRRTTRGSDPFSMTLWTGIIQSLLIFPMIGLVGHITLLQLALTAAVGIIASVGRMRWYAALSDDREHLSRIAPFLRLSSVFVLLMAVFLLHESLSGLKALGAGCIVLSALLVTLERPSATISTFVHNNKAAALVIAFSFSTACTSILYRDLLTHGVGLWTCYFYMRLFQLLPMLVYSVHKETFHRSHAKISNMRAFVFGRVLQTAAAFLYLVVVSHLPLTRVEPIAALTPFMLLVVEWFTHKRRSRAAQPEADGASLTALRTKPAVSLYKVRLLRVAATVVVTCGIVLLEAK